MNHLYEIWVVFIPKIEYMCSYGQVGKAERYMLILGNVWRSTMLDLEKKTYVYFSKYLKARFKRSDTQISSILAAKNYAKWHTTNLVGILYIRILIV